MAPASFAAFTLATCVHLLPDDLPASPCEGSEDIASISATAAGTLVWNSAQHVAVPGG